MRVLTKRYRPEIDGLRIVAILLVVIYHFWLDRVSGGIDVFFVLTGFLITLSFMNRVEKNHKMQVGLFWRGLLKRLLPQALIVLFVTISISVFILPITQWEPTYRHLLASIFYYENWQLFFEAVDYLALEDDVSVFQHFWSLSVQGQIYLIWPLLIAIGVGVVRKIFKGTMRKGVLITLIITFLGSITFSIYDTNVNQAGAYFNTFARIWEFSLGGIVALLLPYIKMPSVLSFISGWLGLVIITFTGIVIQVSTVFPGYMALVPISGALLILIAAENGSKLGVEKLLSLKPLLFLGGLSYGIYLWHWPVLRLYLTYFDKERVSISEGLLLVLLTIILAYVTTKFVEQPMRNPRPMNAATKWIIPVCVTIIALATMVYSLWEKNELQTVGAQNIEYAGAAADLNQDIQLEEIREFPFIPSVVEIEDNLPTFYAQKECYVYDSPKVVKCSYGMTENPNFTVALVGGSHSGHWFPALEILAEEMNFQIDLYNNDGCRLTADDPMHKLSDNCLTWNDRVIEELIANPPDVVFTTATLNKHTKVPNGFIEQWTKLDGVTTIFAIRDNPRMPTNIPSCLATEKYVGDCGAPKSQVMPDDLPWEQTDGIPSNVVFGDLTDYFCSETRCEAINGNIVVYRDAHHLTAEYVKTLAPYLRPQLEMAFQQAIETQKNVSEKNSSKMKLFEETSVYTVPDR